MLDDVVNVVVKGDVVQVITDNGQNYKVTGKDANTEEFVLDSMTCSLYWFDHGEFWEQAENSSSYYIRNNNAHL